MADELTTIPRLRQVFYTTYGAFPSTGLSAGDLAYATDRLVFYRWSGAAWQATTLHCSSGLHAAIPAAADLPNGSLYYETDTLGLYQVQAGAWVGITASACTYPHILLALTAYQAIGQGTWVQSWGGYGSQPAVELYNSTHANGDNITYKVWLKAGTYKMEFFYYNGGSMGILETYIDASVINTQDCNGAGIAYKKIAGISIAADGEHTIKFRVNGSTSGDYFIDVSRVMIGRVS